MLSFPNVKINLGLRIVRKRTDGYHDLETIFYPLPFFEVLEIIRSADQPDFSFISSGLPIEGAQTDNLCVKAYQLLKKDFPDLPAVQIALHKVIPSGAGLGGGSADAAFTLVLLNKVFNLALSRENLLQYSLQLGSDCPFFIINQPCLGNGRGEMLEPINVDLSKYSFVLVNPGIHISTAKTFSAIIPAIPSNSLSDIITKPISFWKQELINDFEKPVFHQYPEIKAIRDQLYQSGALYASLSGSGSSVYGIFEKDQVPEFSFPSHYFVKELSGKL